MMGALGSASEQVGLPPRVAAGRHGNTGSRRAKVGYGAFLSGPRDSAEMRSPSRREGAAKLGVSASSPPFQQPTSPHTPGAMVSPRLEVDDHRIVAAAATIQRGWRSAHARDRAKQLLTSRAQLLAKQAQLEAARARQSRVVGSIDRVDGILAKLNRAREEASESVRKRQAARSAADDQRRSDANRQQAAVKIQMQWLRCRTARRAISVDRRQPEGSSGARAVDLMSYLQQSSSVSSATPAAMETPSCASLTDLLAKSGREQDQRRLHGDSVAMEQSTRQAARPESAQCVSEAKSGCPNAPRKDHDLLLPLASTHGQSRSVAAGVRTHVSTLKSTLAMRDTELRDVQNQLETSERKRAEAQVKADELLERKLQDLRDEYDSTIKRQLEFVDGLLKDKEELAEKYTAVATELEESEAHWQGKLRKQSSTDKAQLKRHRDSWAAAEKVRREKWMEEQMAQVKAQTIKGLEPEIQRMMTQHKNDLNAAEQNHRTALRRARDDMLEENNQNLRRVRQELQAERAEALQHERGLAAKRIREQAEQSEAALRHELTSHAKAKSEWEADRSRAEHELLELRRQIELGKEREASLLRAQSDSETRSDTCKREHEKELQDIVAKCKVEQDELRRQIAMDENETICRAREDLRAELTKERDAQIEEILGRLAEETESRRQSLQAQFKQRVDTMVADHRAEMLQVQKDGRSWMQKYSEIFEQNAKQAAEIKALRTEQQLIEQQTAKDVQQAESAAAAAAAEVKSEAAQWAADKAKFESEVAAQSMELQRRQQKLHTAEQETADALRGHEKQLQEQQRGHERTLEDLNDQVRRVLREKDQTIGELRQQLAEVAEVMDMD